MKRKGLTIFFFSVMALAITPRAMQRFQNYMTAAQGRAQTELLHLLVSFGAPATETQPAPQAAQPTAACPASAENKAQAATVKPREKVSANALQTVAQNRTFEFAFPTAQFVPADFARPAPAPSDHIGADLETRHVFETIDSNVLAPYLNGVAQKAESIKALVRAGKLDEKEAACEMQKELVALARTSKRLSPVVRMRLAREAIAVPAPPAAPATPDSQHASEASMR